MTPQPGVLYRVVVTAVDGADTRAVFDETGEAYTVGVATLTGNRVDALVDHDGQQSLRERLVAFLATSVYPD